MSGSRLATNGCDHLHDVKLTSYTVTRLEHHLSLGMRSFFFWILVSVIRLNVCLLFWSLYNVGQWPDLLGTSSTQLIGQLAPVYCTPVIAQHWAGQLSFRTLTEVKYLWYNGSQLSAKQMCKWILTAPGHKEGSISTTVPSIGQGTEVQNGPWLPWSHK